jgi:hypothetical protein
MAKVEKEITKYKSVHIKNTPNEKYPDMVTLIKTTKKLRTLQDKRFTTMQNAITHIDLIRAELLIDGGEPKAKEDLISIGLGDKNW